MAVRGKKDESPGKDEPEANEEPTEASTEPRTRRAGSETRDPLTALLQGMDALLPGLELLDRDLVFEGGARADAAVVDSSGRLYLVQLAGQDTDKAALEALDAVSVVRTQLELLSRHFGEGRLDPERAPRVLVICPGSDVRLGERLSVLGDAGVLAFALRSVTSAAAGERSYLVRLDSDPRAAGGSGGVAAFLRGLPPALESLGHTLIERMERLDEELVASADAAQLVWRLAGEVLCRVERIGDLLQASVAPRHEPLPLADLTDLERVVEKALGRLVRVLGLTRAEVSASGPRPVRPADEPLLSAEEIQAFRE